MLYRSNVNTFLASGSGRKRRFFTYFKEAVFLAFPPGFCYTLCVMKHVFVINPAAGGGKAESGLIPLIKKEAGLLGGDYEIHRTIAAGETASYVRRKAASGGQIRFYACGGDGTVKDVAEGAIGFENAEVAVIPCGTGNDFVRNFTNTKYFLDLQRQIRGEAMPCDAIRAGEEYCVNMFNIGVDCDVAAEAASLKSRIGGSAAYIAGAFKVLSHARSYPMRFSIDGGEPQEGEFFLAAVANGHFCGGGFKSCPGASLSDGLMDVCIVRPVKGLTMFRLLAKYRTGTHLSDKDAEKYITYVRCRKFELQPLAEGVRVSKDGEVVPFAGAVFESVPGALRIVVPQGCEPI